MGAELILGALEMPNGQEPNWSAAKRCLGLLKNNRRKISEAYARATQRSLREAGITSANAFAEITAALLTVQKAWAGNHRRWTKIDTKHSVLLVTGGESWGDDIPSITELALVTETGIAKAAGFV